MKLEIPYLRCDKHGIQKGYLLCSHLKLSASIALSSKIAPAIKPKVELPASFLSFGLVACDSDIYRHPPTSFTTFCEKCLLEAQLLDRSVLSGRTRIEESQLEGLKDWSSLSNVHLSRP